MLAISGTYGRALEQGEVHQALDQHPQHRAQEHGAQERQGQAAGGVEQVHPRVGPHGVDAGVGHVQDPHDAVDQGEAEGDDGVDGAHGQPVQDLLNE